MASLHRGLLSDLFTGVVAKRLTLVETVGQHSNQHEFQGTRPLRNLFGDADQRGIEARFVFISGENDAVSEDGFLSWSNVRKNKPRAPEYHLYYSTNIVTEAMRPGDMMFLARRPNGSILIVVTPSTSTVGSQLMWLFGIEEQTILREEYRNLEENCADELDFAARYILDELDIELEEPEVDILDGLLAPFGKIFPTTAVFSELARRSLGLDVREDADTLLMAWIEREEALFRRLERLIVADRLREGFMSIDDADVDGFLKFSLSVQNRRKSRAGASLENHLEVLFKARGLRFVRGAATEGRNKPDFLFPGAAEYHDASFPSERLTMLGAKSTLKDRWRQVLSEAERIGDKHLLTLEPSISQNQTDEMQTKRLQLVIPEKLHSTFRPAQQSWLMTLRDFICFVEKRQ